MSSLNARRARAPLLPASTALMSPWGAFVYNALTMGVIFPWIFVVGPGVFPNGNVILGIGLGILLQLPLALSYSSLATVLPSTGGDYSYQSRTLGKGIGFVVVFSGLVLWVLQWLAISGWMITSLGISPLLLSLGIITRNPELTHWGLIVQEPLAVAIISIVFAGAATIMLIRGFHVYLRLQSLIFILTLLATLLMILLFLSTGHQDFVRQFNSFAYNLMGRKDLYHQILITAHREGWAPLAKGDFWSSLAIAPVAWINLQWCTYSVEQGSEVRNNGRLLTNVKVMTGSLLFIGATLMLLARAENHAATHQFLSAFSYLYMRAPTISPLRPFPGLLALTLTRNPWVTIAISCGFIANSFQIYANSYTGVTRILAKMADDRVLPRWIGERHPRYNTLANAHLAYFFAGVIWIAIYNLYPYGIRYTLDVVFANGYVFVVSAGIAAMLVPYRLSREWAAAPVPHGTFLEVPWITWVGGLSMATGGFMLGMLLFDQNYGVSTPLPFSLMTGLILLALVIYMLRKSLHVLNSAPSDK